MMTTKKWNRSSPTLIQKFLTFMENYPNIENKKMFGYPCCFLNGNMFTGLHEENWIIRLSESDREEITKNYNTSPFEPMPGRVMKEYVILPSSILADFKIFQEWMKRSIHFVSSLPPKEKKPAKRKNISYSSHP